MASIPSKPTRSEGSRVRSLAWPVLLSLPLFFDVFFLFTNRPFHKWLFEGELGLIELPTFIILVVTVAIATWGAFVRREAIRKTLGVMALGLFYWAGEEVSWGQTFFHWKTPEAWAKGNYQKEENIHNTRGIVGTLTNQTPRLMLDILTILCVVLAFPAAARLRTALSDRLGERWLAPLPATLAPAALSIAVGLLNKTKHMIHYQDFGETQELYVAIFLLTYVVGLLRTTAPGQNESA